VLASEVVPEVVITALPNNTVVPGRRALLVRKLVALVIDARHVGRARPFAGGSDAWSVRIPRTRLPARLFRDNESGEGAPEQDTQRLVAQ
jgi:hypothetical protein